MSSVFHVDLKLLYAKSEHAIRKASRKLDSLHTILSEKVVTCLDKMSNVTNPSEAEVTAAFGDIRVHTKSSEPYYYEQVYKRLSPNFPIPVDSSGRVRIFTPREKSTEKNTTEQRFR